MPGTVAITFSDAAGRDSAVSAATPLPVTAGGATPAGQTPPASEAPVPIGGLASATAPTAVTAGQRVNAWYGLNGQQFVQIGDSQGPAILINSNVDGVTAFRTQSVYAIGSNVNGSGLHDRTRGDVRGTLMQKTFTASRWNYVPPSTGIVSSTAEVTLIAAAGAGVRNFLLNLQVDHESLVGIRNLEFRDGPSGAVLYRVRLPIGTGYGRIIPLGIDGIQSSANTALVMALSASDTGSVIVAAQGGQG